MTAPAAPAPAEVSALIAWMRRLSDAGHRRDPAELAAFRDAKKDLLARIQAGRAPREEEEEEEGGEESR